MRVVLAAFLFVSVAFVNIFPKQPTGELSPSPNEFSRYELVVSMAERGTFSIDRELAEFGDHEDKSIFGGHFYSNKAPGLSLAALPFYVIYRPFVGRARRGRFETMFYLLRLSTVTAAVFLALLAFARRLERAGDPRLAPLALFAVAFGTPLLVYARSFFSHAWTAALLYLAFDLLHRDGEDRPGRTALAGALAGLAVLSEYPAAIVAVVLLLDAVWGRPRRGLWFAAGALPFAAFLGYYDWSCFGGVLQLSSRHEAFGGYTALSRSELLGFGVPRVGIALRYLFSENRGVLFASPFFLLLPAAVRLRSARGRALAFSLAAASLYFLLLCGYRNWHGGWALGSRYLVPILLLSGWPLAAVGGLRGERWLRVVFAAAATYSAAYFFFSGSTYWMMPAEPARSIRFYSAYWLAHGWLTPGVWGPPALAAAAAGGATLLALGAALAPLRLTPVALVAPVGIGLAAFALLFSGPEPRGDFGDRLTRARILESFTDLDPGRHEIRALRAQARTPEERSLWTRAARAYGVEDR